MRHLLAPGCLPDPRPAHRPTTGRPRAERSRSTGTPPPVDPISVLIASRHVRYDTLTFHATKCMRSFFISPDNCMRTAWDNARSTRGHQIAQQTSIHMTEARIKGRTDRFDIRTKQAVRVWWCSMRARACRVQFELQAQRGLHSTRGRLQRARGWLHEGPRRRMPRY